MYSMHQSIVRVEAADDHSYSWMEGWAGGGTKQTEKGGLSFLWVGIKILVRRWLQGLYR